MKVRIKIEPSIMKLCTLGIFFFIGISCTKFSDLDYNKTNNKRPYVQIKLPINNESFIRGDLINFSVDIYDLDSNITNVYLFIDDSLVQSFDRIQLIVEEDTINLEYEYYFKPEIYNSILKLEYDINSEIFLSGNHVFAIQAEDEYSCFIDSVSFYLFERGTNQLIKDYDGNSYNTVKIGKQIWFAENLRTTHFKDGTAIPLNTYYYWKVEDRYDETYSWYKDDSTTRFVNGAFYNIYSAENGKLCPANWHVPSIKDWEELLHYTDSVLGPFEKAYANDIGEGYGYSDMSSVFLKLGGENSNQFGFGASGFCSWWALPDTSGRTFINSITFYNDGIIYIEHNYKRDGLPVRCIKD